MRPLDYLICNARIIDPETERDFRGSLGIAGGKIAALYPGGREAESSLPDAGCVVDAGGGLLVPGFIDVHAHSDNDIRCAEKLLAMGVTTALSGNCGLSPVNFPKFFAEFERQGYPVNQAEQVGHSELRKAAGQRDIYAPADAAQLARMKILAREAFAAGASGLSFGLEYAPGTPPEEALEMAALAAKAGRLVSIHTRLDKADSGASIREALELSVRTGARVIVSHLVYMFLGDSLKRAMEMIDSYRARGADVWVDSGMYTAFASFAGTPCFDESVFTGMERRFDKLRAATGKYAGQVLDLEKYREIRRDFPGDSLIYDPGRPEDIFTAYSLDDVMVSTDCIGYPPGQGHPQGAATYPYFLRLLVKERRQFSLVEALRRTSLIPARALRLEGKGRICPGADADLTVLDWDRLRERADFPGLGDPDAAPDGVTHVFVNGVLALKNEQRLPNVFAGLCLRI
jgi:N-acyl-D-amino-acid deacylase